jgi:hypothetical protein
MVTWMFELFMVLLFGVQWFCSPFPVESCSEMKLMQTCHSTSHFNVPFVFLVSMQVGLNSQCCPMAVGLFLFAAFCRYVVSCYLYRRLGNA